MGPKNMNKPKTNKTKELSEQQHTIISEQTILPEQPIFSEQSTHIIATNNIAELITTTEPIKAKRGRKSKKELMESLNINTKSPEKNAIVNLNINEITTTSTSSISNNVYKSLTSSVSNHSDDNDLDLQGNNAVEANEHKLNEVGSNENKIVIICKPGSSPIHMSSSSSDKDELKPATKKRGRKPKGGKIIQQISSNETQKEDKPNVILHLKCSMKDLNMVNNSICSVESYNFAGNKADLNYDLISNETTTTFNDKTTSIAHLDNTYENDGECDIDDDSIYKDSNKEIWKKLKQLEHNLHINNVNNKRSACFWDTCEFHNPPIYIPKHFINGTYHVYGCFCSPECGVAYLMNENIDSSTKFERYHMFNHIYTKIYDYKKNIKPAPNPHYMLEKYYGNLSIQEYRSLLRNERLFLIVDKPLTRILPELHEDNDDFILNNKIIPSNNYHIKTRLQRKKQNKTSIVNEKFGIVNQAVLE
jgi:hypothetical protein